LKPVASLLFALGLTLKIALKNKKIEKRERAKYRALGDLWVEVVN